MGYIVLGIVLIVVVVMLIVALTRSGGKPPRGTLSSDKPLSVEKPAAEEANPSASDIASRQQAEHARKHTPPA